MTTQLRGEKIGEQLLVVKEGRWRAAEYALAFCMLTARSGCNKIALKAAFRNGLNVEVLKELACREEQVSLNSLIDLAI